MDWELYKTYGGTDYDLVGTWRNVVGSPVVSASHIADGSEARCTSYAGVYRFTLESTTTVSIEGADIPEVDNPILFAGTRTVVADDVTENLNLLPGWSVVLAADLRAGDVFEIAVGAVYDEGYTYRPLALGPKIDGLAGSGILLKAKNVSGSTLTDCRVVVTNAIRVENDISAGRPFKEFSQTGVLNPYPHTDLTGAPITFTENIPRRANAYVLAMTSNINIPHEVSADWPASGYAAYKAFDGDTTTEANGFKSTKDPYSWYEPLTLNLRLDYMGGGAQTFTHAEIYPFYDSTLNPDWSTFPNGITFQGYSTGTGWKDLTEYLELLEYPAYGESLLIEFTKNIGAYTYYRMMVEDRFAPGYPYYAVAELKYGTGSVLPCNVDISIDGEPVSVFNVSTEEIVEQGINISAGTTYRFVDASDYQSGVFVLSNTIEASDTATIYVSDCASAIQLSSDGTTWVAGADGLEITEAGQAAGTVTNNGTANFYFRCYPPPGTQTDLNMRSFSLRLAGVDGSDDEYYGDYQGSFSIVEHISPDQIWKIKALGEYYPLPRYAETTESGEALHYSFVDGVWVVDVNGEFIEDPNHAGQYIYRQYEADASGEYVADLATPGRYILASLEGNQGNYADIKTILAQYEVIITDA